MHITLVHVHVHHDHIDEFIEATRRNHEASVREPGNLRFDFLQAEDEPRRFLLVEVYRGSDDAAAHKKTAHYLRWRETVEPWMAAPRRGVRYRPLAPEDAAQW